MVFALILERIVWGTTPPVESFVGSAFIIGAAIWISVQKKVQSVQKTTVVPDEESSLLGQADDSVTDRR